MSPVLLDIPPEKAPILEVFIWIGIHADGREAMLSGDFDLPLGRRHMPLISSRRELAEKMGDMARQIQQTMMHQADRVIRIELRTFRA